MNRRDFVRVIAGTGAGLSLGVSIAGCGPESAPSSDSSAFAPDAWIRIDPAGTVTVIVDKAEMGQGISTALPMLVAEELDADWSKVRYRFAPPNEAYYNPAMGMQGTGGSSAVRTSWLPLREAGAKARAMLIAAAARQWSVPSGECRTEPGVVVHLRSGRRLDYGALATAASRETVPANVALKDPKDFRLIGRPVPRLDAMEKVTGQAVFGLDAGPRNALVALVARCPAFGGSVKTWDAAGTLAVPGVRSVFPIESGIAVVAETFWAARKGREALVVEWSEVKPLDDVTILAQLDALARTEGRVARKLGDVEAITGTSVEATYFAPYLAHATMEPINCTADVRADGVTIWVPTQFQAAPKYLAGGGARGVAASVAGVSIDDVQVHTTHLGGGFGRRFEMDVIREAVAVSKRMASPVRLMWTREDDIRHDAYRPAALHVVGATLDGAGVPIAWRHRVATQSIMAKFIPRLVPDWVAHLGGPLKGGIDSSAVEGAADLGYDIPNLDVRFAEAKLPIPVGYWRSVGHSHTAFAVESFLDEIAAAGGRDPVELRRLLSKGSPRRSGVLELAAEKARWGTPLPDGRFQGVAVHESFGSWVAQVAEVSVIDGKIRVHRVVCAIDCGRVVNPDTVAAQMESSIVYGLTAALKGRIAIEGGRVRESNFHDYAVLRISEMPVVETYIVPSVFEPGGVGEPGTPPIAPAVANAVFRATGQRLRTMPLRLA